MRGEVGQPALAHGVRAADDQLTGLPRCDRLPVLVFDPGLGAVAARFAARLKPLGYQVTNGVASRMAVLFKLLSSGRDSGE